MCLQYKVIAKGNQPTMTRPINTFARKGRSNLKLASETFKNYLLQWIMCHASKTLLATQALLPKLYHQPAYRH
jgi:hypothetical protein